MFKAKSILQPIHYNRRTNVSYDRRKSPMWGRRVASSSSNLIYLCSFACCTVLCLWWVGRGAAWPGDRRLRAVTRAVLDLGSPVASRPPAPHGRLVAGMLLPGGMMQMGAMFPGGMQMLPRYRWAPPGRPRLRLRREVRRDRWAPARPACRGWAGSSLRCRRPPSQLLYVVGLAAPCLLQTHFIFNSYYK